MPDYVLHWGLWALGLSSLLAFGFLAFHLVLAIVLIIPTWRICIRAGFAGAWSLLHLVPVVGSLIVMAILAFGDWPNGEAQPNRTGPGVR